MKGTPKTKKKAPSGDFAMPGVDVAQLEKLLDFMAAHGLEEFEYEHGGLHIRLRKASSGAPVQFRGAVLPEMAAPHAPAPASGAGTPAASQAAGATPAAAPPTEELHMIKSPIVGTFYGAPSPEASPFVKPGDSVQTGQVVCIVEAMKLMNEIESDISGEVVRVLIENGQPVEYGQGLFAIRPVKKK